jgi:hypothetical protein
LKIARVKGWLSTPSNRDAFLKYWCAEEYWVSNYLEGYSAPQIQLPAENIGKFKPDGDYVDEVGEIRLQPPGDRKVPKVGRRKNKRHKSRGEEGSARKSRRRRKVADSASENSDKEDDERSFDQLLWGNGDADPEKQPDDSEISAEGVPAPQDFIFLNPAQADAIIQSFDAESADAAAQSSATESCGQNSNSEEDLTCLQLDEDADAEPANSTSGAPNSDYIRRARSGRAFVKKCLTCGKTGHTFNN